ncbi:MAG TPA: hypothetical protein PK886_01390 [Candidatus Paceibacterota bacterium]|nr:hypothetical protein [Candidatus Paceibacterota bacterium]
MNKKIIIPLVSVGAVLALIVWVVGIQNNKLVSQQAASIRYQNPAVKPDSNARSTGLPPTTLACTSIAAATNPPALPSTALPNLRYSPQEVISRVSVTSTGCTPGDAFLNFVDLVVYESNSNYTRLSNINLVDLTTGNIIPAYDVVYSFPLVTAKFKPNFDVSQNGTRTFEVRADLNLDIATLVPGDYIFSVMSNFIVNTSTGNVPVDTSSLSQQTMTF